MSLRADKALPAARGVVQRGNASRAGGSRVLRVVLSSWLLASCVSIDHRALTETIDKEATRTISGDFSNHASYRSRGEFIARDNLAELFDVPARLATHVHISFDAAGTLEFRWFSLEQVLAVRTYSPGSGMSIASDGAIDLPTKGRWGSGDGAWGYQTHGLRIFVTPKGDLATIQHGGGAGGLGPIPIGIYARHLAIFPRK